MKILLFLLLWKSSVTSAILPKPDVKYCLAVAYGAQLCNYLEDNYYTDRVEDLKIGEECEALIKKIELPDNESFILYGEGLDGKDKWSINQRKELINNLNLAGKVNKQQRHKH